jgi:choline kinase
MNLLTQLEKAHIAMTCQSVQQVIDCVQESLIVKNQEQKVVEKDKTDIEMLKKEISELSKTLQKYLPLLNELYTESNKKSRGISAFSN